MSILMRGKKIAVEKLKQASSSTAFLAMPEDASAVGIVRFISPDLSNSSDFDLKPGMRIYYGKERHELKMNGVDMMVMEESNVYAIVRDDK